MISTEDVVYRRISNRDLLAWLYKPVGVTRCPVNPRLESGHWSANPELLLLFMNPRPEAHANIERGERAAGQAAFAIPHSRTRLFLSEAQANE